MAHPWRGNARELENVVERALALSDVETLGPEDVPLPGGPAPQAPGGEDFLAAAASHGMTLHELGERYTEQVLRATGGNKVQAARILGIDRKTLYRRAEREARAVAAKKEE
jgi:DNA-binding NtrC family response regulator